MIQSRRRKDPHLFNDPHPQRKVGMLNVLSSANYHLKSCHSWRKWVTMFHDQRDREKVVSWQFEKESLSDKLKNLPHFQQIASARHWHFKWSNWNALTDGIFRSRRDDDLIINLSYTWAIWQHHKRETLRNQCSPRMQCRRSGSLTCQGQYFCGWSVLKLTGEFRLWAQRKLLRQNIWKCQVGPDLPIEVRRYLEVGCSLEWIDWRHLAFSKLARQLHLKMQRSGQV